MVTNMVKSKKEIQKFLAQCHGSESLTKFRGRFYLTSNMEKLCFLGECFWLAWRIMQAQDNDCPRVQNWTLVDNVVTGKDDETGKVFFVEEVSPQEDNFPDIHLRAVNAGIGMVLMPKGDLS